jgi:putative folate metabolism gamma-glutamate ligase
MRVTAIKTKAITTPQPLTDILDSYLPAFEEEQILVITSKIVSICQGRVVPVGSIDKDELIQREADWFLPRSLSKYDVTLTIRDGILIANAGIDESNGNGSYTLWPEQPFVVAKQIAQYLRKRFSVTNVGVVLTDSRISPLRWGTFGVAISWYGFDPLNNYIDTPDIFGKFLHMTKAAVADGLAASAVLAMGEGNEQTPLATIAEIPFVTFTQQTEPSSANTVIIDREDDLFHPVLGNAPWQKGGHTP